MTIYEENIKALAKYYPGMDELIEEAKKKYETDLEVFEEEAYTGETILKVRKNEKNYYLNGKRNTTENAEIWVKSLGELYPNTPVFMFGVGNWSYLKELVENTETKITIIVYEPCFTIFLKFLELVEISSWLEKQLIVFWVNGIEGMNKDGMRGIIQRIIKYEMASFIKKLEVPNYDELFKEELIEFYREIRDSVEMESVQYNTKLRFADVTVKNLISSIKFLPDAYKTTQLVDVIPRDIPGIVVAAGPSLNKNIKELKKAKGKAFIIAVDTALKPLLAEGIIPDMFAVVDAKKPLTLVDKEEVREIPLLTNFNANSEILEYHTGKKFFSNEGILIADKVFQKSKKPNGTVESGGSVATTAFSLLYKIGLERIILVGQDLAFTGNKSHADGTFEDVMKEQDTKGFVMVEGNVEEKVPTRGDFKIYLDWYGKYIQAIHNTNPAVRVINATEGGAKIKGTEIMTLHDAIEQECTREVDIQECMSRLEPMLEEEAHKEAIEYLRTIPNKFGKLSKDAKKARGLYVKLDKLCDRNHMDSKEYLSLLKKIKKINQEIESNETYQLVCLTMINAQYILWSEQFVVEDSFQAEGKELARKGMLYTENVAKMAHLFEGIAAEKYADL